MRRDMETVRRILRAAADAPGPVRVSALVTDADDALKVSEHVVIMREAGLICATLAPPGRGPYTSGTVDRLTWEGQDMLAAIDDPGTWERVKARLASVGGDCALSVIKAVAVSVAGSALGV